jgi:LuxR family maltose regulon positive regulatory protein
MATPILTTKLHIPSPRPNLVPRQRLLERLDQGLQCRLTLVSAPAGFGKTTLLSEWIRGLQTGGSPSIRAAWISLDEADNDPARFSAYLAASLRGVGEGIDQLGERGIEWAGSSIPESHLVRLINRAAALPHTVVLVLDDYHLITSQAIHDAVTFLIDHLPENLHLVLATRADPPLALPRLRARGHLIELRQSDLRFTREEVATFLRSVMGFALSAWDVDALEARTEGWIAGLQMAAVSMQQRDDLSGFVRAFAGSHRYVMDYLLEEVLHRQSIEVQTFLIHTSILERLSAPLCDAISLQDGQAGSQSVLEYLEQSNLFITPLDDHRVWYRYHRLFADLLRRQLSQHYPDLVPELHRRASAWFEEHALLSDSIEHALAAGDLERAAVLIERVADPLLMRSEVVTLRRWLDALPETVLRHHPGLCAYHAWLLLLGGEPLRIVERRMAVVEQGDLTSGTIQAVRALIAVFEGELERVAELTERARALLTEEDGFWYLIAQWLWDLWHTSEGDLTGADAVPLRHLIRSQIENQNVLLAVLGLCSLGELRAKQGHLQEAEQLFRRALAQATDSQDGRLPIAGQPLMWLGELARERNDLPAAERYLTAGLDLISQWGRIAAIDGYTALARLQQAQGDAQAAYEALEQAERLAVMFDATEMDDEIVALCRARIAALEGAFTAVERWVESQGLDTIDPADLQIDASVRLRLRKYELATLGLARIREGRPREALAFLEPLLPEVTAKGRWGLGIEILALQAAAYHMVGETPQALICLEEALARAEPEGYVRLFVEVGEPMAQLLYEAAQRGIFPAYAGRLLAAFPRPSSRITAPRQAESLIEPLSERELEVLAAIADGLSNQEIAHRLSITERTVKWHASNIYGKLHVSNRTEAVAKARSLGILGR